MTESDRRRYGYCKRCGGTTGSPNVEYCTRCHSILDKQRKEYEKKMFGDRGGQQRDAAKDRYTSTSGPDGGIIDRYDDGRVRVHSASEIKRNFRVAAVILVLLVLGALVGVRYYFYSDYVRAVTAPCTIETPSAETVSALTDAILAADRQGDSMRIIITDRGKDGFLPHLLRSHGGTAEICRWQEDGKTLVSFDFDGYDAGTGLSGRYYLAEIDKTPALIDLKAKTVYPQGTDTYEKYKPLLDGIGYPALMQTLTKAAADGETGTNAQYDTRILSGDTVTLALYGDGSRLRALDRSDGRNTEITAVFYTGSSFSLPDLTGFATSEGVEETDPLKKLLNAGGGRVNIHIFENADGLKKEGTELADILYESDNGRHSFRFDSMDYQSFTEDTTYILDPEKKTLTCSVWNNDTLKHEETVYQASEKKEQWDTLLSLVPRDFVCAHMDLDTAEKSGFLGIVTTYVQETEGEKDTLYLTFGRLNGFTHETKDGKQIRMSW